MTDELVKRLKNIAVHSYLGRSVIEEAAYRIEQLVATNEQLTAERDKWKTAFDEACDAWQKQCEHEMDRAKKAEAERDDAFECNEQFFVDNQFLKKRVEKAEAERDRLREALRHIVTYLAEPTVASEDTLNSLWGDLRFVGRVASAALKEETP